MAKIEIDPGADAHRETGPVRIGAVKATVIKNDMDTIEVIHVQISFPVGDVCKIVVHSYFHLLMFLTFM